MIDIKGEYTEAVVFADTIDNSALGQLTALWAFKRYTHDSAADVRADEGGDYPVFETNCRSYDP